MVGVGWKFPRILRGTANASNYNESMQLLFYSPLPLEKDRLVVSRQSLGESSYQRCRKNQQCPVKKRYRLETSAQSQGMLWDMKTGLWGPL